MNDLPICTAILHVHTVPTETKGGTVTRLQIFSLHVDVLTQTRSSPRVASAVHCSSHSLEWINLFKAVDFPNIYSMQYLKF